MEKFVHLCFLAFFIISCSSAREVSYFQQLGKGTSTLNSKEYSARIKPKDLLSITVVSSEPEASRRYNLITPQDEGTMGSLYAQPTLQNYLVNNDGNIKFPVLGILQVQGLSTKELQELLEQKLSPFFKEEMPIVTIRIVNFSVNILGEVLHPGKYESVNERMTILEGLAMAGDLTIYGKRNNVKVIREGSNGEREIYTLNLNDGNIFNSPAFFLEQNDVVYVEPNQSRANSSKYGAAETYRISTMSVIISLATMAVAIFGISR